jgi:hypothetical protein
MGNAAVELGKKPKGTPKPKKQEKPFLVLEVRRGRKNLRFFLPLRRYKIKNNKNYKTHKTYKNKPNRENEHAHIRRSDWDGVPVKAEVCALIDTSISAAYMAVSS